MNLRIGVLLASIAVGSCLAACSTMTPAADTPDLDGTAWLLSGLPTRTSASGGDVTLRFEEGRAGGTDGCNRYSMPYTVAGTSLRFENTGISTQMACDPTVMQRADAFRAALGATRGFRVEDGQLRLLDANGTLVAALAPQSQGLAGTEWQVTGFNNGRQAVVSTLEGTSLSLSFAADGKVSGSAGCNRFTGTYTASGTALGFGPAATTRRMCPGPEGVMDQEQQFLRALESVATARREGDRLELRTADGELAVTLKSAPTP